MSPPPCAERRIDGKKLENLSDCRHCPKWHSLSPGVIYTVRMKKKELTPEQLSSVPCPTCGVPAGKPCVLHSGAPRSQPHVDRKFAAVQAVESTPGTTHGLRDDARK